MTKTCLQCGAILPSGASVCRFCETSYPSKLPVPDGASLLSACVDGQSVAEHDRTSGVRSIHLAAEEPFAEAEQDFGPPEVELSTWRGELVDRLEAYRVRRRKITPDGAQSKLPFSEPMQRVAQVRAAAVGQTSIPTRTAVAAAASAMATVPLPTTRSTADSTPLPQPFSKSSTIALEEPALELLREQPVQRGENDFSFTIAIGRIAGKPHSDDGRLMIDVSERTSEGEAAMGVGRTAPIELDEGLFGGRYPVAAMGERRLAALIDVACLLFACGAFFALFGSLGGQFTFSKLNAAVCAAGLAIVYVQYFALFTIFGGTTPGMMFRHLQVMSFTGEPPTSRQMLLRSAGYALSALTFFMGFWWAMWDEDELTWHDRFSRTYLSSAETYAEVESHTAAHPH